MKRILALFAILTASSLCFAQTETTGALTGIVTDPTGGALPNAVVTIANPASGIKVVVKANAEGRYNAGLLKPGTYAVTATFEAFKSNTTNVAVALGSTTSDNIKMVPAGATATVDVNAADIPLLDTQNIAQVTTLEEEQIQNLPAPGGDVTTVAFTQAGVVVNAGGEYGNFSSDGLPGVSNLFVLNGFDNQDPFLNLNNSGSSNLTLGQGELSEVSIVQNAYNSQFGRAAGAEIFYNTKSGTNRFHGMADYYGNTSVMNANSWFGNYNGAARPHAVSNEWAANIGGPIFKDKLFFFADYEGLRYVLPGGAGYVNFPSAALQSYILSQVPSAAASLYTQAFNAYKSAPAYATATPVVNGTAQNQDASNEFYGFSGPPQNPSAIGNMGCGVYGEGGLAGTPTGVNGQILGVNTSCITTAYTNGNNINKEWLFTGRLDYAISSTNHIYARYKVDHGSQPTSTSSINPLFSAISIQPEDEGQLNDTIQITPNMTNSFTMAANWYSAYFGPVNQAASLALYPDNLYADLGYDYSGTNSAGGLSTIGVPYYLTQGRDVSQYQFADDFQYQHGKNTYKAGFNFRRDLVTDYDQQIETVFPAVEWLALGDYAQGQFGPNNAFFGYNQFDQAFISLQHAHLALYNLGIYAQDEYQAKPNLKLTMGARIDRTGNPYCGGNCFSAYQGSVPSGVAASDTTGGLNSPYDSANGGPINPSNAHPFPSVQPINFQGRFGFNYAPDPKTEITGGFGMFADLYPAGFLDSAIQNFPNDNAVTVYASGIYGAGNGTGTVRNFAANGNSTLQSGFASGESITQINSALSAQNIPFAPPAIGAAFPTEFKSPEYLEFSLKVQHMLGRFDAVSATYAGNKGYNLVLVNPYGNPGDGEYDSNNGTWQQTTTLGGFSAQPLDPRFSRISIYSNAGYSNYNGLLLTYKHSGHGFTGQFSYTWSHALDTISNGGTGEPWNGGSLSAQLTPSLHSLNLNYSNADYDVRNNFVGDLVYSEPNKFTNPILNAVAGGWTVGAKTYARGGEPFSITNPTGLGNAPNLGTALLVDAILGPTDTCGTNPRAAVNPATPCLNKHDYVASADQTDFGNLRRNSLYGPHYVNTDILLTKRIVKAKGIGFLLGANAYNIFNHPNFANPSGSNTGGLGVISSTVAPPTSPYGSFQGAAVTQRIVQIHGKLTF